MNFVKTVKGKRQITGNNRKIVIVKAVSRRGGMTFEVSPKCLSNCKNVTRKTINTFMIRFNKDF